MHPLLGVIASRSFGVYSLGHNLCQRVMRSLQLCCLTAMLVLIMKGLGGDV